MSLTAAEFHALPIGAVVGFTGYNRSVQRQPRRPYYVVVAIASKPSRRAVALRREPMFFGPVYEDPRWSSHPNSHLIPASEFYDGYRRPETQTYYSRVSTEEELRYLSC